MFCTNCDYGDVIKCTENEISEKKYPFPNIGICDICGTSYIMHYSSGQVLKLTLYGAIKPLKNTSSSLKLYQRVSFSLIERETIVAMTLELKNINKILDIVKPIMNSNGSFKQVKTHIKERTITIVPKKIMGV